jgi:hypothetical protein
MKQKAGQGYHQGGYTGNHSGNSGSKGKKLNNISDPYKS